MNVRCGVITFLTRCCAERVGLLLLAGVFLVLGGLVVISDTEPASAAQSELVEGVVSDEGGEPVQGARVTDGSTLAITDAQGMFSLERAALDPDVELRVSGAGYRDWSVPVSDAEPVLEIALESRSIRALYLNPTVTTSAAQVDNLIEVINTTKANAVVIDIKEDWVWYDTEVAFFQDAGTVRPAYDIAELLQTFRDNDIYTIARLVVFKDSTVAEVHSDLAIRDVTTGGPWRDLNGFAWVNPMLEKLWEPNIDLAVEAASFGFDEIQYDYVRFPTDGDLSTMDFGVEFTQASRENAIEGFLAHSRERLLPTGAKQSADVFGFTMVVGDDLGIGQNFPQLAAHVDYLSPMVYPSHYSDGQFGLPGHPNDFPYEIVDISLRAGVKLLGGDALQIRPWLQDFDLYGMAPYAAEDVRAQIRAANELGTSGWMLWDPENRYRRDNLDPAIG
ncbi:MAG: GTP-binding protein [Chloroflexia bacterium]|nr:GTP-binding protein [Chloroflexia bacterium]